MTILGRVLDRDTWRILGMVVECVRRVRTVDGSTVWLLGPARGRRPAPGWRAPRGRRGSRGASCAARADGPSRSWSCLTVGWCCLLRSHVGAPLVGRGRSRASAGGRPRRRSRRCVVRGGPREPTGRGGRWRRVAWRLWLLVRPCAPGVLAFWLVVRRDRRREGGPARRVRRAGPRALPVLLSTASRRGRARRSGPCRAAPRTSGRAPRRAGASRGA